MKIKAIEWATNYRAVFGDLGEPRVAAWCAFIEANVWQLQHGEINRAMASLCAKARHDDRGNVRKPGVQEICSEILTLRGVGRSAEGERKRQRFLAACRDEINRAETDEEIWEAVCAPTCRLAERGPVLRYDSEDLRAADCKALLAFAQEKAKRDGREFRAPNFDWSLARRALDGAPINARVA